MPRPPAFVSTPTRRPRGSGWLESSAAASISSSSVRARRTPAWRKSASTARSERGERGGVRARGPGAGARAAGLQREDRLVPGDALRDAGERARVAERLEVEQHEVGVVVLVPPLEQVVRRDIGLVPDRDEAGEAEPAARPPPRAARARARRSGTRSRCARAAAAGAAKVASRCAAEHGDAEAVRADEPRAVRAHEREQRVLALGALGARLGEARGDHAERADAGGERGLGRVEHVRAGHADHREVDRRRRSRRSSGRRARRRRRCRCWFTG